ncbi:type I restriction enzyme, S subunit [Segatella bryantii]|uniref:restriction endonuclease subunit S n=1 Tax=Segatella bryantii TaxID=77095 RepID=UPI00089D96B0|nr:restriction endonuclease subunit S [Segatella bryantii]SEA05592.1 type I restriction enzyme, S subunit [Segatella bryantii]
MSEWKKVKLGECCEITSSKRIFQSDYVPVGIPFYRSKEIAEMQKGESISDPLFISNDKYEEIKCKFGIPQKGDLLLTAIGATLGIPFVIKNNLPFYFKDGNLIWFKNFNDLLDSSFLYSWMCSSFGYQSMQNIAIGSAQKALTISALKDLSLIVPPIDIQHRIATILSRYDSLIENYQKQIKLLEEAAQRLYKEWFVDLHFSGHENVKIVDGVPEGWEKKKLVEIAELKAGGDKPEIVSAKRTNECSVPIFSNGTTNEGLYGYTNFPVILEPSVTISARGSVGYTVFRRTPFVPIVRLISVTPHNIYVGYIFYCLKSTTLDSNGAAQQQITIPMIRNKEITIPSKGILELFESQTEPIFNQIDILKELIRLLTEARDRLLPKLMSGEIEI